jgi:hypothetical protein
MKVSLMNDIAAKKKKGTYKESEVNPGGIALYMYDRQVNLILFYSDRIRQRLHVVHNLDRIRGSS